MCFENVKFGGACLEPRCVRPILVGKVIHSQFTFRSRRSLRLFYQIKRLGNSQEVKGYAQLKGRAMPKLCEKGCAQKLLSKSGNSHKVKGYEGKS